MMELAAFPAPYCHMQLPEVVGRNGQLYCARLPPVMHKYLELQVCCREPHAIEVWLEPLAAGQQHLRRPQGP